MPALRHTLISASAGSGKTYQLVQRYLQLLALGVPPDRIAAMTFTRKAAGEFVNRILLRLALLADDAQAAAAFGESLGIKPGQGTDFAAVLRQVLNDLPRLRLGTIDSFFAAVTACFPLELGLPVGAAVMAEEESRVAAREALESLLAELYRAEDNAGTRVLLEAFKQATFGHEEKKVLPALEEWIHEAHDLWHECDDGQRWGRPAAIWPKPLQSAAAVWQVDKPLSEVLEELVAKPLSEVLGELVACFSTAGFKDKALDAWEKIQEQVRTHEPGKKPDTQLGTFLDKLMPVLEDLHKGQASFEYHRCEWLFEGPSAKAALALVQGILGRELLIRCQRTQGIYEVVSAYEAGYDRTVRRRGRLSFADLTRLLAKAQEEAAWAGQEADLWYRLDGKVDHWLFDEFQDTSAQQWSIMRGLVDEVLQDAEQRRSFFAVGDVKQSIYLWRKAEAQLFSRVLADYPDDGALGIEKQSLARSYRSTQEVLDLVNGVYLNRARLEELLGKGCLRHWEFERHTASTKTHGFSALLQPGDVADKESQPDVWDVTAALLRELQPMQRRLTCAVLVRSNNHATQMVEFLREHTDLEVSSQSEEHPACDNPVTAALLAVLQLAAHPGDTLALQHLRMTPLAEVFAQGSAWRVELDRTLQRLQDDGFAPVLEAWADRLPVALDEFSSRRVQRLLEMAAEFDETGGRSVDAFLEFALSYGSRTGGAPYAVQVMTVHKSKGLEFDVVLLPLLDTDGLTTVSGLGLVLKREGLEEAEWVLQYPPKPYDELDPVLAEQKQRKREDAGFQNLCALYVAMTRAKQALYVVAPRPPKKAGTVNAARLLRDTVAQIEESDQVAEVEIEWLRKFGDSAWYAAGDITLADASAKVIETSAALGALLREHQPLAKRRTPSGEEAFTLPGKVLFSAGRDAGRELGTLLHQMMEQIEWVEDDFDEASVMAVWQAKGLLDREGSTMARDMALQVIRAAACRAALAKPGPHAKVWRERSFDLVMDGGDWVSGTLDRVVIECDAQGRPLSASIIDFKTDDVADAEALAAKVHGYQPQIKLYREAVMRLTGLPADAIRARLLFTRRQQLADV